MEGKEAVQRCAERRRDIYTYHEDSRAREPGGRVESPRVAVRGRDDNAKRKVAHEDLDGADAKSQLRWHLVLVLLLRKRLVAFRVGGSRVLLGHGLARPVRQLERRDVAPREAHRRQRHGRHSVLPASRSTRDLFWDGQPPLQSLRTSRARPLRTASGEKKGDTSETPNSASSLIHCRVDFPNVWCGNSKKMCGISRLDKVTSLMDFSVINVIFPGPRHNRLLCGISGPHLPGARRRVRRVPRRARPWASVARLP